MNIPFENQVFTPDEVAEILKIHPQTIRKWINEGKIRGFKVGAHWRVTGQQITDFIKRNESIETYKSLDL